MRTKRILIVSTVAIILAAISISVAALFDDTIGFIPETTTAPLTEPETTTAIQTEPETTAPPATDTDTEAIPDTEEPIDAWVEENRVIPDVIPEFVQGDMVIYSPEDARCRESYLIDYLPTYRDVYYEYATFLSDEIEKEAFREWYNNYYRASIESGVEFEEMPLVNFIKEFHITRDVFEKAYAEKKQAMINAGVYTNHENAELPNADIIYTFDNEIINNYYRRDHAEHYGEVQE